MNRLLKQYIKDLWMSIAFWAVAMGLFSIFRYYGLDEEEGFTVIRQYRGITGTLRALFGFMTIGVLIGILYATVDFAYEKITKNRLLMIYDVLITSFLYFIISIGVFTIVMVWFSEMYDVNLNTERGWWKNSKSFWATMLYMIFVSFVFSFIKIAREKFGKGVFLKMLMGKYKNPKEEKRIFMFLDLKDSTTIAENLGHFKYSQFIQDCFYDLNEVVPKYDAEIYQYVGDEAVLSWPYQKGLANNNCVDLFFAFQQKKQSKAQYYLDKYGVIPEFKAGVHGGVLMVTEVGVVKKEIAYHGDVINTSARIQAECNKHKVLLLISEKLLKDLEGKARLSSKFLGSVLLKGKQEEINIHAIDTK